jgi:hypothetical protein
MGLGQSGRRAGRLLAGSNGEFADMSGRVLYMVSITQSIY